MCNRKVFQFKPRKHTKRQCLSTSWQFVKCRRLGVLVSDIHGQAARAMVKVIIAGKPMASVLDIAGRLRASRSELFEALQTEELSAAHLFVLAEIKAHIEDLEARLGRFEQPQARVRIAF